MYCQLGYRCWVLLLSTLLESNMRTAKICTSFYLIFIHACKRFHFLFVTEAQCIKLYWFFLEVERELIFHQPKFVIYILLTFWGISFLFLKIQVAIFPLLIKFLDGHKFLQKHTNAYKSMSILCTAIETFISAIFWTERFPRAYTSTNIFHERVQVQTFFTNKYAHKCFLYIVICRHENNT